MEHKKTSKPYSSEFRERAVRMLLEHRNEYLSLTAALVGISSKLGCFADSLRSWSRQQQRANGDLAGPTSINLARFKELEREVRELR